MEILIYMITNRRGGGRDSRGRGGVILLVQNCGGGLVGDFFRFFIPYYTMVNYILSLLCSLYRFLDAMLIQREFKQGTSSFSKRVSADDQARLVRDRLYVLKQCVLAGKDTDAGKEPYLYHLH